MKTLTKRVLDCSLELSHVMREVAFATNENGKKPALIKRIERIQDVLREVFLELENLEVLQ